MQIGIELKNKKVTVLGAARSGVAAANMVMRLGGIAKLSEFKHELAVLNDVKELHPDVAKYVGKKYYAVKLDAESKEPITVGETEYKYIAQGKKGIHELAYALLGARQSYPSVAVLDEDLSKLTIIQGYMDAQDMDRALRYFGDGYYDKGIKWGIYEKNFKSRIKGSKKK